MEKKIGGKESEALEQLPWEKLDSAEKLSRSE